MMLIDWSLPSGKSVAIVLDVSGASGAIASGVDKAWGAFGGIDILVNNAGVIGRLLALRFYLYDWNEGYDGLGWWLGWVGLGWVGVCGGVD